MLDEVKTKTKAQYEFQVFGQTANPELERFLSEGMQRPLKQGKGGFKCEWRTTTKEIDLIGCGYKAALLYLPCRKFLVV